MVQPVEAIGRRVNGRAHAHDVSLFWLGVLAFGGAALTLAALVAIEYGWPPSSAVRSYVTLSLLLLLIAAVGIASGAASRPRERFDLFELPVWYTLWTLFSLVLFGLFGFSDDPKYWLPALASSDWIADGLWLVVLGLAGLWCGYRLLWFLFPFRPVARLAAVTREPSVTLVWVWYGLTLVERVWRIRTLGTAFGADVSRLGDASVFNQWSIYVEESVRLVLPIVALQVFRGRWPARHLVWMLIVELLFTFLTGFIKPFMWLTIALVAVLWYAGYGVRARLLPLFVLLALTIIGIPIVERYRVLISTGAIDGRSIVSMAGGLFAALESSWGQGIGPAWEVLADKIGVRQARVAQILGVIVYLTPDFIPHWGVDRLLAIPFYLVPRALWPDKPSLSDGVLFSVQYLNAPSDTNTSSAFTMYGDLYLAAGWTAVFVGMFALGIVCALLYRFLKVEAMQRGDLSLTALYIALAVSMADIESSYIGLMTGLMQRLVLFGALFWALHPRVPRRPAPAANHVLRRAESPGLRR